MSVDINLHGVSRIEAQMFEHTGTHWTTVKFLGPSGEEIASITAFSGKQQCPSVRILPKETVTREQFDQEVAAQTSGASFPL